MAKKLEKKVVKKKPQNKPPKKLTYVLVEEDEKPRKLPRRKMNEQ